MNENRPEPVDRAAVRFPPPLVYLSGIAIGVGLDRLAWPLEVPGLGGPGLTATIRIGFGGLLVALGMAAMGLAYVGFRRTGQNPKPWTPTPAVVTTGLYRYSRNPMYVGMALIQVGIGVATGVFWIVVMVVPVLVTLYYVAVRHEEVYLERKFGAEYLRYKASTRRWI